MFRGIINDAKSAAGSVASRYAARATVAVPFLIAVGFATAAGTLVLIEQYGSRDAYLIVGGVYTMIGLIAAILVRATEKEEAVADIAAVKMDTDEVVADTATAAAMQIPLVLLGELLTSSAGPASVRGAGKVIVRNLPLIALGAALAVMFWPTSASETAEGTAGDDVNPDFDASIDGSRTKSNGIDHSGNWHRAA